MSRLFSITLLLLALSAPSAFAEGWVLRVFPSGNGRSGNLTYTVSGDHHWIVPLPFKWLTCDLLGVDAGTYLTCEFGELTISTSVNRNYRPSSTLMIQGGPGVEHQSLFFAIDTE